MLLYLRREYKTTREERAMDEIKGIKITEEPITLPNDTKMFFIRDQDNNVIEFHKKAG
jgi:hypothetical protein